jgi:isocitrate/isopropylmalate dehydrogenase
MTTISWLTLFKEIIAVYSESQMKHINTLCGQDAEQYKHTKIVYVDKTVVLILSSRVLWSSCDYNIIAKCSDNVQAKWGRVHNHFTERVADHEWVCYVNKSNGAEKNAWK